MTKKKKKKKKEKKKKEKKMQVLSCYYSEKSFVMPQRFEEKRV